MEPKFFINQIILIIFSIILTLASIIRTEPISHHFSRYEDNLESSMRRLEFGKNYTNRVTEGKVNFEYTEEKGVFCKAAKHLNDKEFTFDISKEFILCSFELYPYMFELKEPIHQFFIKKYGRKHNETLVKTPMYMFTLGLMFARFENKTEVFDHLKKVKKDYYITNYTNEFMEYLESLPGATYSQTMFGDEERKLQILIGFNIDEADETRSVHEAILNYVVNNMSNESQYILPWINDLYQFKYFSSIITSRAYKATLQEFEKLINKSIITLPMGRKEKQMLQDINPDMVGTCLVPFVDLCNHNNPKDYISKEKIDFLIIFKSNRIRLAFAKEFNQGEDYEYSYTPYAPNEKLLNSYGFYVENNPQSVAISYLPISKKFFPKAKHDLCLKLKCFDGPFDNFYADSNIQNANIQTFLNKFYFNERMMKAVRLLMWPNNRFDAAFLTKRLKKGKMLGYENEMMSLSFYRNTLRNTMNNHKLKYIDIIYSLNETRNYYKANRAIILANPKLRYLYRLRRRIMEVAKENHQIISINILKTNQKIKHVLSDQFSKIRNYYSNANLENLTQ